MMSSAPPQLAKVCQGCGAKNPGHLTQCWLCEGALRVPAAGTPFKPTSYERHAALQFSFASLLVTIALIAVLLGSFRLWPGLGVLLLVIVAPAWIGTCIAVMSRQAREGAMTFGQKAGTFATSLAIVVGTGGAFIIAVLATFVVLCAAVSR